MVAVLVKHPSRLRLARLAKRYGERRILDSTSLELGSGVKALVGRNGVGKSTLLCMLAGIEPVDAGEVWIDGLSLAGSPVEARRRLAYVPDRPSLYPFLTGREFLSLVHRFKGVEERGRHCELLERFGIADSVDTTFSRMSLGMQRKFLIVAAFIGEATVVLMDEPTNGLDAASRQELVKISRRQEDGRLFVYATHDRDFIDSCAAEVLFMRDARVEVGVAREMVATVSATDDDGA
jgi:ABC-type multidrug transport system ATPase subunit